MVYFSRIPRHFPWLWLRNRSLWASVGACLKGVAMFGDPRPPSKAIRHILRHYSVGWKPDGIRSLFHPEPLLRTDDEGDMFIDIDGHKQIPYLPRAFRGQHYRKEIARGDLTHTAFLTTTNEFPGHSWLNIVGPYGRVKQWHFGPLFDSNPDEPQIITELRQGKDIATSLLRRGYPMVYESYSAPDTRAIGFPLTLAQSAVLQLDLQMTYLQKHKPLYSLANIIGHNCTHFFVDALNEVGVDTDVSLIKGAGVNEMLLPTRPRALYAAIGAKMQAADTVASTCFEWKLDRNHPITTRFHESWSRTGHPILLVDHQVANPDTLFDDWEYPDLKLSFEQMHKQGLSIRGGRIRQQDAQVDLIAR